MSAPDGTPAPGGDPRASAPPAAPPPPPPAAPPPLPGESAAPAPPPLPGAPSSGPAAGAEDDGGDTAGAEDARAVLHVTEETRTYPCRACGGQLEFHIGEQELVCPHCGNHQDIVEGDGAVEEQDYRDALAALRSGELGRPVHQLAGEKEVACQSCGGRTTFTGTLTSTRCPYCATPIQRDDVHDAPARLAVDGVLPFAVDDDAARAAIRQWIKSRWFAPNDFKKYHRTGAFSSVYMAYFTYDADATTNYAGRRGDTYTVTVGEGENRRTETRVRWSHRSGRVHNRFDDMAVCANTGIDDRHVAALEPWPTPDALPFSAEYVAGHLCRTYDQGVEQCFGVAEGRMQDEVRATVRRDIGGDRQDIQRMDIRYGALGFKHLLLPIWLLTVIFKGEPFQVLINGVTGEVQGQRPWSAIKIALAVVAVLTVVGVAVAVRSSMGG